MKIAELTLMICEKRWDEMKKAGMRWEELRWGQKKSYILRWDEVWSAKCKFGMWSAKSIMRSVRKIFVWYCLAPGLCAQHVLVQYLCKSFAHTHARAWLAYGTYKFYKWERSYISLRQFPSRLIRVLLMLLFLFF
jgi:hypothetical protein